MAKLKLTVACGDYEIVRALSDGTVEADGIELVMLTGMGSRERHWRMARKTEFDVCEINIGGYYMGRERSEALTAIPVFLHRRFRHGFVFVNAKSGIREPKDLIGKKIGGTNFQPASNIWMRGILEEYYGVPHRQCIWVVERSEDVEFTPPKDLRIEMIAPGKAARRHAGGRRNPGHAVAGHPAAVPRGRQAHRAAVSGLQGHRDRVLSQYRNFSDHARHRHQARDHRQVSVGRDQSGRRHSKRRRRLAYRRIANPRVVPLAWIRTAWEEQQEILGHDPWAYGLGDANRKNLETALRYCHQQGLISRMMPIDDLFADTDLGDAGGGLENI